MTDGISFGKGRNVNFTGFNGISSEDMKTNDAKKQKLRDAIILKYDKNNDGILDKVELKQMQDDITNVAGKGKAEQLGKNEAKKFLTDNLNLKKGDYNREDLLELLEFIGSDVDSISDAETDSKGNTTITYKPDEQTGDVKKDMFNAQHKLQQSVIYDKGKDDLVRTLRYAQDGQTLQTMTETEKDKKVTTYQYANDGETLQSITEKLNGQNPVVTELNSDRTIKSRYRVLSEVAKEYLDESNGNRVKQRVIDKGQGLIETTDFVYNSDGSVDENTYVGEQLSKLVQKGKNGHVIRQYDYTYDSDGARTSLMTEGDKKVKTVRDKDFNIVSSLEVDDEGNPLPYEHTVDKENDTWYGIVQAKYGITDHKTTMEIVHQLKDRAVISYNALTMPDKITLPAKVTLSNGQEVGLKNIYAQIDERHNVAKHINIPRAQNIPQNETVSEAYKTADTKAVSVPESITVPDNVKTINVNEIIQKYPQDKSKASQVIKTNDGLYIKYGFSGSPFIYDHEPKRDEYDKSYMMHIQYNSDGIVDSIYKNELDENGYTEYDYDNQGNLTYIIDQNELDNDNYISYKADGSLNYYNIDLFDEKGLRIANYTYGFGILKYEHDEQGREVAQYSYDQKNGNLTDSQRYNLDENGNVTRAISYDENGNVTKFMDYLRRADGRNDKDIYYNADGLTTSCYVYKHTGKGVRIAYEYDAQGNLKPQ